MSLIMHRCKKCSHPDYRRDHTAGARNHLCPCGCRCAVGKPEVAPTFDVAGQPIERIVKPGDRLSEDLPGEGRTSVVTCGCGDCEALYAQLTTA